MIVLGGDTNVTTYFAMRLTADGKAATGLTISGFDLQYTRSGVAPTAKVDATELAATDTGHTDNFAKEIDATDQPGLYRVDWPDAAFAAGVREAVLTVKVATCFTEHLRVEIDPFGAPAGNTLAADIAAIKAETVFIVADTNELQGDDVPTLISNLNNVSTANLDTACNSVTVTSMAANVIATGVIATDALDGDAVNASAVTKIQSGLATASALTTVDNEIATIDTVVDGIQTDLSNGVDGLGALKTLIDALNDLSAASVWTRSMGGELSSLPSKTVPTMEQVVMYCFTYLRNKVTSDATEKKLFKADGSTALATFAQSQTGGTYTQNAGA